MAWLPISQLSGTQRPVIFGNSETGASTVGRFVPPRFYCDASSGIRLKGVFTHFREIVAEKCVIPDEAGEKEGEVGSPSKKKTAATKKARRSD